VLLTDAVQVLAQAVYVGLFLLALARALRRPERANREIALFFGDASLIVLLGALGSVSPIGRLPLVVALGGALLLALPYLLLRLLDAFAGVRTAYLRGAEVGLAAVALGVFVLPMPQPLWYVVLAVAYFVVVAVYASVGFVRGGRRARGVTRRRLQAIGLGSAYLALDILTAGFAATLPAWAGVWMTLGGLLGLASGLSYGVGFAPPTWLRRAWQEPELRSFLERLPRLAHAADSASVVHELQSGAAATVGAAAAIGLWQEDEQVLRFYTAPDLRDRIAAAFGSQTTALGFRLNEQRDAFDLLPGHMAAGQAFAEQQPVYLPDAPAADPAHAAFYRMAGSLASLATPITAGSRRLGVLIVYAARAPIFADSDLELVQVLADQAAVVLESRLLSDEAARARAREEADRLKDEFLAAISHDLKNPLAAVRAVAQVLERRLQRDATIEPERLATALTNITLSTVQMASMVDQLLDYARLQMDRPLDLDRQPTDLVALARQTVSSYAGTSERHELRFETQAAAITGQWDRARLERALQNLIGNAVKYSPQGGQIVVRAWTEMEAGRLWGLLSVADQGLGVPAADLPRLFERFHRGVNVAGRIGGTGIGLATVRQIVEQHGGQVSVSSTEGQGSTFTVRLPLDGQPDAAPPPSPPGPAAGEGPTAGEPPPQPAGPPHLQPAWRGAGA